MSQWFPKMCEYDRSGWHTDPYIGREFYGVWGDFDVTIVIDSAYTVAATGTLKNAKQIAHGYGGKPKRKLSTNTWHFMAKNVHDFVWTADPDYIHDTYRCKNGVVFHMFYQDNEQYTRNWKKLPSIMEEALNYANEKFGIYPYPQYSFIQGGDGGMEYPMATLFTGNRPLVSLVGVSVHEFLHSWFYGLLGFNESYYYWMDEGFTNYAEIKVTEHLKSKGLLPGDVNPFPFEGDYKNYYTIVTRGIEEPLSTHADHFEFNSAYSIAAYTKGSIFLNQMEYIVGTNPFASGMLDFFNRWKYKHPVPDDLILSMEKASGLQLEWYRDYMVFSSKTIDYSIDSIYTQGQMTIAELNNFGKMPMPVDVKVTLKDGSSHYFTIPLDLMLGSKSQMDPAGKPYTVLEEWKWVMPVYWLVVPFDKSSIEEISLDPLHAMADMDRLNNVWPRKNENE
jgi:aminopeptidase N